MINSIVNFIIEGVIALFVLGIVLSIFGPIALGALAVILTPFKLAYDAYREHRAVKPRVEKEIIFDPQMIKDEATNRAYEKAVAEEERKLLGGA